MDLPIQGFPGGSGVENSPTNAGNAGLIPGLGRSPGEGNSNSLQYSCLGNPMERSLVGFSSWGCKRVGYDLATKQNHLFTKDMQTYLPFPEHYQAAAQCWGGEWQREDTLCPRSVAAAVRRYPTSKVMLGP